jgi:hypothetical protein
MFKFYINFQYADQIAKDDEGEDLPCLEAAEAAAIRAAREILANNVKHASRDPLIAVFITNPDGLELARIACKDILPEPLK